MNDQAFSAQQRAAPDETFIGWPGLVFVRVDTERLKQQARAGA